MESPCLQCSRVKSPANCENKLCKDWQFWFIDRWEAMRKNIRVEMESAPVREIGVPLDGLLYSSPHRVREYLRVDPCQRCLCPKEHCHHPCPAKEAWLRIKSGVCE